MKRINSIEAKRQLLGNHYYYVEGEANERFSPNVDESVYEIIEEKSKQLGVSRSVYLMYRLLDANMDDLLDLQYTNRDFINACRLNSNAKRSHKKNGKFAVENERVKYKNESIRRCKRIETRVTQRFLNEIKSRSTELSLLPSEYTALVFRYYDAIAYAN